MKTFSEAMASTLFAKVPIGDFEKVDSEVSQNQDRYDTLLEQVQGDPEVHHMIRMMVPMFEVQTTTVHEMMVVAFSHGVMVGIEMEKAPLLVGRDPSDVPPDSTEAKEKSS